MFENFFSLDHFLFRAGLAGIGIALLAGPVGCFLVWRRMAYLGDTLAHSALLGVSLALLFQINLPLSVFCITLLLSCAFLFLQRVSFFSSDSLLGILSHAALAFGLLCLSLITWLRVDVMSFLLGDILAVSRTDLIIIFCACFSVLGTLIWLWRPLFAVTVHKELADAEGIASFRINLIFLMMTSAIIAIAMKILGILLITALMIIPAITARRFCANPEKMAVLSAGIGVLSVIGGLCASALWDLPSGPSIVASATLLFVVTFFLGGVLKSTGH